MRRLTATTLAATAALSLGSGAAMAASPPTSHGNTVRIRHVNRAGVRERSTRERHGRSYHDSSARDLREATSSMRSDR